MPWYRAVFWKEKWLPQSGYSMMVFEQVLYFEAESMAYARGEVYKAYISRFDGGRSDKTDEAWAIHSLEECLDPEKRDSSQEFRVSAKVIPFKR